MTNPWTEITHWAYDGEGKLRLQNNSNGTHTKYCYNEGTGWPTQITHSLGATVLASYGLQYDNRANTVGNLTQVNESDGSQANYVYDDLYRLTSETRTGTAPVSHSFGYDLAGNRTTYDGVAATFDAANKQNGQTYDGDGNVTNSGTLTWDDQGNLIALTGATYQYDNSDSRVISSVGSTKTFYIFDGNALLGEVQANNAVSVAYTWGASGIVSERLPTTSRWYQFGPQGETRQLTNETGSIVDTYIYSVYGQLLTSSGIDYNPFKYGGRFGYYSDAVNGYLLCGQRWYNCALGRWLSRDPMGYDGGDNLYSYCKNNPVKNADPSGLQSIAGSHKPTPPTIGPWGQTFDPHNKAHEMNWDTTHANPADVHYDFTFPTDPHTTDPHFTGPRKFRYFIKDCKWVEKYETIKSTQNRINQYINTMKDALRAANGGNPLNKSQLEKALAIAQKTWTIDAKAVLKALSEDNPYMLWLDYTPIFSLEDLFNPYPQGSKLNRMYNRG